MQVIFALHVICKQPICHNAIRDFQNMPILSIFIVNLLCRAVELREQGETREAKAEMGGLCKRDVKKAGEEEDWKKKTRDRGGWKRLADEAVKKLRAAPHP